jgi:hypothetical protein
MHNCPGLKAGAIALGGWTLVLIIILTILFLSSRLSKGWIVPVSRSLQAQVLGIHLILFTQTADRNGKKNIKTSNSVGNASLSGWQLPRPSKAGAIAQDEVGL